MNESLLSLIQKDYAALWQDKVVRESIEIQTPYKLADDSGLILYITIRDGKFIVANGGGTTYHYIKKNNDKWYFILKHSHGVSAEFDPRNNLIYYKTADKAELVPSAIFDLANFLVATSFLDKYS